MTYIMPTFLLDIPMVTDKLDEFFRIDSGSESRDLITELKGEDGAVQSKKVWKLGVLSIAFEDISQ